MKNVVSISIGSSARDHDVRLSLLGEKFHIWREGTNGDMQEAVNLIRQYDGEVAAFGLGGIGLLINAAGRTYYFRDGKRFGEAARKSPMVCGTGLKGVVEGDTPRFIEEELGLPLSGKHVGVVSTFDRWGLTEAFRRRGCVMTYGDLPYSLGIPIMVHDYNTLVNMIHVIGPIAMQLPFKWLYPTTSDHTTETKIPNAMYRRFYHENDIIAGDWKYIKQYMPLDMRGKWIVTNTTTMKDVDFLRKRGVELLVTTTPRLEGRSFGTNVIEATMVALDGATSALPEGRYLELLRQIDWKPDVLWLQGS
jgi:hypothetical protein